MAQAKPHANAPELPFRARTALLERRCSNGAARTALLERRCSTGIARKKSAGAESLPDGPGRQ